MYEENLTRVKLDRNIFLKNVELTPIFLLCEVCRLEHLKHRILNKTAYGLQQSYNYYKRKGRNHHLSLVYNLNRMYHVCTYLSFYEFPWSKNLNMDIWKLQETQLLRWMNTLKFLL